MMSGYGYKEKENYYHIPVDFWEIADPGVWFVFLDTIEVSEIKGEGVPLFILILSASALIFFSSIRGELSVCLSWFWWSADLYFQEGNCSIGLKLTDFLILGEREEGLISSLIALDLFSLSGEAFIVKIFLLLIWL